MSPATLNSTLAAAESKGLGFSALRTLCFLVEKRKETITPRLISDHIGLTTAAITHITDQLLALGYITRENHPEDRRKLIISITPSGTKAIQSILSTSSPKTEN